MPPQWVSTLTDTSAAKEGSQEDTPESAVESSEQAQLDSSPCGEPMEDVLPIDAVESDEEAVTVPKPQVTRSQPNRYALRKRVSPPQRVLHVSSGRASSRGEMM